nr:hypothetical protein HmN_000488000 [Hymenolepis microstoma]
MRVKCMDASNVKEWSTFPNWSLSTGIDPMEATELAEDVRKICPMCLKMHSSIGDLFRHCRKQEHLECSRCNILAKTFYLLLVHYITEHCDLKMHQIYRCFECQRKEYNANVIVEHWFKAHGSFHIGRFFILR